MTGFRRIPEVPRYAVDAFGAVVNLDTDRLLRPCSNQQGRYYVGLYVNGERRICPVAFLVARAFLDPPPSEYFDSVIHHDYDLSNSHVDNLSWRPRWFAMKYHHQGHRLGLYTFWPYSWVRRKQVINLDTNEVVGNAWITCMFYGILLHDLFASIQEGEPAFPTSYRFAFFARSDQKSI